MATPRFEWKGKQVVAAMGAARLRAVESGAIVLQRTMKRTASGSSPSSPGSPPGVDRGGLRRSIVWALASGPSAQVGTILKYGAYLERGTNYTSKPVPVPVNDKAKRMLRTLSISGGRRASLRTKNLQFIKRKGKPPLLVEKTKTGKDMKGGAVFVIKRTRMAPRPWVLPSFNAAKQEIADRMRKTYGDVLLNSIRGGGA